MALEYFLIDNFFSLESEVKQWYFCVGGIVLTAEYLAAIFVYQLHVRLWI